MTKVGSEGDSASPLTGVQVEGGFAPTGPSMEKLIVVTEEFCM